jgi:hypothetical protein
MLKSHDFINPHQTGKGSGKCKYQKRISSERNAIDSGRRTVLTKGPQLIAFGCMKEKDMAKNCNDETQKEGEINGSGPKEFASKKGSERR